MGHNVTFGHLEEYKPKLPKECTMANSQSELLDHFGIFFFFFNLKFKEVGSLLEFFFNFKFFRILCCSYKKIHKLY